MTYSKNSGFTLVEISIVLLIVAIILGYTMAMVPVQQDLKKYKQADDEMNRIIDSLYAFAQVNGYLPCPAFDISFGFECREGIPGGTCNLGDPLGVDATATCDYWFGSVPGKTLGIEGKYGAPDEPFEGLLLDPWGEPYKYQVTDVDAGGSAGEDFIIQGEMKAEGIGFLVPDLSVCNEAPATATSCGTADKIIASGVPIVIVSTGKDAGKISSPLQNENADNGPTETVFVKTTMNKTAGAEFDDLVKWVSPNVLYSKMLEAGQLP